MAAQDKVTFKQDLTEPVKIRHYEGVVFTGDDCGNLIKVALFDGGVPYSDGGTVSATAVLADGTTFPLTQGSITGNMVSVPLEAGALVVSGLMGLYVKISGGGIICTVLNAIFTVQVTDTGRVPAATVTTVNELVAAIRDAQDSIPADLTNLLAAVAPTFSTSTAYSAGAYVWQGGKLYRFTAAHPAGTWTGTDAVTVALGDDVADLKSASAQHGMALVNDTSVEIPFTWEYGNINTSGADANSSSTIYARTVGYFQPYQEMDVVFTRTAGANIGVVKYQLDGTFVSGGRSVFSSTPNTVRLSPSYKYRFFHNGDGTIEALNLNGMRAYLTIKTDPVFITGKRLAKTETAVEQIRDIGLFGNYASASITTVTGKLYKVTTLAEMTMESGAYALYTIGTNEVKARVTGYGWSDTTVPLYAVLDANNKVLVQSNYTDGAVHTEEIVLPLNAYKIVVNGTTTDIGLEIFTASDINNAIHVPVIACTGDSVTEGMSTDGAHTADYGKDPYPAQLYTMLKDAGYRVSVLNQGHGGERIPEIAARIGAYACVLTEDITVPGDGSYVSLGTATVTNGRVTGTKLAIPYADDNDTDYNVYFTQITNTNSITIDGVDFTMTIVDNTENKIRKTTADGVAVTIKAGTPIFTNNDRSPDVNIIFGGINDLSSLTLDRYIKQMKACAAANKGKYLILGAHSPMWNSWSDLTGTASAKYATYKRACLEAFGVNWIDLYAEFTQHALEYALEGGFLSDLTNEEKTTIQSELDNKHIPGEFTYNGTDDNVHLNRAGYYVLAKIIFYRLIALKYV